MLPSVTSQIKAKALIVLVLLLAAPAAAEYADFNGNKVYYKVMGQGGPALVLIHGWSCDHTMWRFNTPELSKKYKLVLVDMPGHGNSGRPRVDYTFDFLVRGVAAAIKASGVKNPVLAGHSMGAPIAREVVRRNPGLASGLIIVDGALDTVPTDPKARAAWDKQYAEMVAGFKKDYPSTAKSFVESMLGPAITPELKRLILDKILVADPYVAASTMQAMSDPHNWRPEPVKLRTMAIYAESPYLPPDFQDQLTALFPNLTYKQWKGVGHFFFMEEPDKFNRQVIEFMDK